MKKEYIQLLVIVLIILLMILVGVNYISKDKILGLDTDDHMISEINDIYIEEDINSLIDEQLELREISELIKKENKVEEAELKEINDSVEVAKLSGNETSRGLYFRSNDTMDFKVTSYDLSFDSCEKTTEHPEYGLTASGYSLKGMTREDAMTIAADTSILPMGTTVLIEFHNENYQKYNGVYTVRDRGGAVKGYKIDIFMGDFNQYEESDIVHGFGITTADVTILE